MSGNRRHSSKRSTRPGRNAVSDESELPDLHPTMGIPSQSGPTPQSDGQTSDTESPDSETDTGVETLNSGASNQQPRPRRAKRSGGQRKRNGSATGGGTNRYQTEEQIGRGGWGVVQRAVDQQLHRQVAIKRILSSGRVHPDVRDRFLYEARITSQLQHPGIVPVHELQEGDTGDDEADTYYVMKLLSGRTLRQHIAEVHAERRASDRNASRDAHRETILPLLERFIDICETVAYAHQQGVIHRDLKPANVMVGQFGETIVVDWGLAKRLGETDSGPLDESMPGDPVRFDGRSGTPGNDSARTSVGSVIGTPAYMSPEQACGEIDALSPASDVYSLGAILYEILTGEHPHAGCDLETVLRRVRAGESSIDQLSSHQIPRPLIAICKKATAVAPSHRYGSATEIADDVRCYIAGDAVSADRENWTDKLARWCRRHRTLTISAAVSTVVLLLASAIFGYQIRRAHLAEQQAHDQTRSAYEETLVRLTQSRQAADSWLTELSGSLEFYPGMQPIRRDLIQRAIEHYEDLLEWDGELETSASVAAGPERYSSLSPSASVASTSPHHDWLHSRLALERCKVQLRLGDLHRLSGRSDRARHHYGAADRLLVSLQRPASAPEWAEDVGLQAANITTAKVLLGDPAEAIAADRLRWLEERLREAGINGPMASASGQETSVREVSTAPANDLTFDLASGLIRLHLACARSESIDSATAAAEHARLAATWARWLERTRGRVSDRRLRQTALSQWATLLDRQGDHPAAAEAWGQLVRFLELLLEQSPDRIDHRQSLAYARLQWANALAHQSESDPESAPAARRQCEAAIEDLRLAWQQADIDGFYQSNLATAENNLGRLLLQGADDQLSQARQHLEASLRLRRGAMRQRPAVEELRHFCQTVDYLLQIETEHQSDDDGDAEPISVELLDDADTAYQLIRDHDRLQPTETDAWARVLETRARRYRAGGQVDAAEADGRAAKQLREPLETSPAQAD